MRAPVQRVLEGPAGYWLAKGAMRVLTPTDDPVARLVSFKGEDDPAPFYARLHERGGVRRSVTGMVTVGRHETASMVLRDRRFLRSPSRASRTFGPRAEQEAADGVPTRDDIIISMDPPRHPVARRILSKALVDVMPELHALVDRTLDELLDASADTTFDAVAVATQVPGRVVGQLVGAQGEDQAWLTKTAMELAEHLEFLIPPAKARRQAELRVEMTSFMRERLAAPNDPFGFLESIADARARGDLTEREALGIPILVAVAGFETTQNLLAQVLTVLADEPEAYAVLRDGGDQQLCVEEVLRLAPPTQVSLRVADERVDLGDRVVEPGDVALVLLAAANRDPDVFSDPDRFLVGRPNAGAHLSFGGGSHYCPGASLARYEANALLRCVLERWRTLEPAGPRARRPLFVLRGYTRSPIRARR